ncbi:hypothetical protein AB0L88_37760 [Saccharopolyspora shandongensis]
MSIEAFDSPACGDSRFDLPAGAFETGQGTSHGFLMLLFGHQRLP